MDDLKTVVLPSGAELKFHAAPFEVSDALFQAVMEEVKAVKINAKEDLGNLMKDLFCVGVSSKKIRSCIWACMEKATYDGLKITKDTFEPVKAREDYLQVCFELAKENISPFSKVIYAQYSQVFEVLKNVSLA